MSWQDSFTPDDQLASPQAPQAVQAQGWQSSFVPDNQPEAPNNSPVFSQNPTWGNFGKTALQTIKDMPADMLNPIGDIGAMVYGDKPIITGNVGETAGNIAQLAMPLLAAPAGASEEMAAASAEAKAAPAEASIVTPTSSDIDLIKKKLDLAGITPQQYADALTNSSPDDFAGELGGEPLRMQTQAQAKITGPAMQPAREAMQARLDQAPQRTQQIIEKTFFPSSAVDTTVGGDPALASTPLPKMLPVEQAQGNLAAMGNKASDLYTGAANDMVPRRGLLTDLNTTQGQEAMARVLERPSVQKSSLPDLGIIKDPETGFIGFAPKIPVPTAQMFAEELGQNAERNQFGQVTSKLGYEEQGQGVHANDYIGQNSPAFGQANANYAGAQQGSNAFDMGRKLAHSAAGEKADEIMQISMDNFSPQEQSLFKTGYAQGLSDVAIGSPISGGSPASRIAKGTVTQTTSNILGSTDAQKLADALMQEKGRVELAQRGLSGSNTAETLSAAGLPEVPLSPESALKAAGGKIMDFVNSGKNARIAQLLYATSPEQKAILAQKILQ